MRFAVVGLGLMGERHCRVIQALPSAMLAGVYDHHEELGRRQAEAFGTARFETYEQLLACPEVDAVIICLPSGLHARFGMQAAAAGKHVVVEKPIDSQSVEAHKLVRACESAGVKCAVISQNRYSPGLAAIKTALEQGIMGKPNLARATVKWFRHDEYYSDSHWRGRKSGEHGGVLMNQAIHSIDTLQWWFGVPDMVSGYSHCTRPGVVETEDTAVAIMKWNSGLLATLEASTNAAPGFDEGYEVHSPIATARVEKGELVYWHHNDGLPAPAPNLCETPDNLDRKLKLFFRQYLNIVDAITGKATPGVAPMEAVTVVETVEEIYRSAGGACGPVES